MVKKYRSLDPYGKDAVTAVLDCEYKRCQDNEQKVIEIFPTRRYLQPASAGYGNFNDDASYEMVDLVKRPPVGTSFIIAVNGKSMEPTYSNGDLVFVQAQKTIKHGEIGLFAKGGDLYIKESGTEGLVSHNKDPKYALIVATMDEPIEVEGKIIGICTPDYLQ